MRSPTTNPRYSQLANLPAVPANPLAQSRQKWTTQTQSISQDVYRYQSPAPPRVPQTYIQYIPQPQQIIELQRPTQLYVQHQLPPLQAPQQPQNVQPSMDQLTEWKQKCFQLEQLVIELQGQNKSTQNQMNEFKQKCTQLEQMNIEFQGQNNNQSIQLNEWKQKCFQLEQMNIEFQGYNNNQSNQQNDFKQKCFQLEQMNLEFQGANNNLQIQLNELKQKCFQLEQMNLEFQGANNNLSIQLNEMKQKCFQVEQMNLEFQGHNNNQSNQLNEWKQKCLQLEQLIIDLQAQNMRQQQNPEIKEKITYVEDLERVRGLEERINILLIELEKLNYALLLKNKEIQDFQARLTSNQFNNNSQESEVMNLRLELNQKVDHYSREIRQLQILLNESRQSMNVHQNDKERQSSLEVEIFNLRSQLEQRTAENSRYRQHNAQEYEQRAMTLSNELDRANQTLMSKSKEIDNLLLRIKQQEMNMLSQNNQQVDQLSAQLRQKTQNFELLLQETESLSYQLKTINEENEQLRVRVQRAESSTIELRQELSFQSRNEMDKVTSLLRQRSDELEQMKVKCQRLELSYSDSKVQQDKCHALQSELEQWRSRYQRLEAQNEDLRLTCDTLERKVVDSKSFDNKYGEAEQRAFLLIKEKERLEVLLNSRSDEINQMRSTMVSSQDVEVMRQRCQKLEYQLVDQQRQTEMRHDGRGQHLEAEIDKMKVMLRNRLDEIETWKTKCYKNEEQFQMMRREIDYLKIHNHDGGGERVTILTQEITRLNSIVGDLRNQVDHCKTLEIDQEWLNQRIRDQQAEIDKLRHNLGSEHHNGSSTRYQSGQQQQMSSTFGRK